MHFEKLIFPKTQDKCRGVLKNTLSLFAYVVLRFTSGTISSWRCWKVLSCIFSLNLRNIHRNACITLRKRAAKEFWIGFPRNSLIKFAEKIMISLSSWKIRRCLLNLTPCVKNIFSFFNDNGCLLKMLRYLCDINVSTFSWY